MEWGTKIHDALPGIQRDQKTLREGQNRFRRAMMPIEHWFGEFREEDHAPDPLPGTTEALLAQEKSLEEVATREDAGKEIKQDVVLDVEVPEVHEVLTEELLECELPPQPGGEDPFKGFRGENREEHRKIMSLLDELQGRIKNVENQVEAQGMRAQVATLVGKPEKDLEARAKPKKSVETNETADMETSPFRPWRVAWKVAAVLFLCFSAAGTWLTVTRWGRQEERRDAVVLAGLRGMARYVDIETTELEAMVELPKAINGYISVLELRQGQAKTDLAKGELETKIQEQREALAKAEPRAKEATEALMTLSKVSGIPSGPKTTIEVSPVPPVGE